MNQIKEGVQRIYADADTGTTYGYKDPTGGEAEKGHDEMLMKEKLKKIKEELEENQLWKNLDFSNELLQKSSLQRLAQKIFERKFYVINNAVALLFNKIP